MLLIIDNYDSFTYNLAQYLAELGAEVGVRRNDQVALSDIEALSPTHLVISPGPGGPDAAGISLEVIKSFAGRLPILGVCLGHQCIAQAFGGSIRRAPRLMHGKTSSIFHDGRGLFRGLPRPFSATRYHSLIVEKNQLPAELEVTARCEEGEIMGLRHRRWPVEGVQFHPESYATQAGKQLLANFLNLVSEHPARMHSGKAVAGG